MTASPEPGTQDLAKMIAEALLAEFETDAGTGCDGGPVPYIEGQPYDMADALLAAFRAAGLIVAVLPEPDVWLPCEYDTTAPQWKMPSGELLTAFADGVEADDRGLVERLEELRIPALKTLAAVAACEKYRAERQGGEPQ